jgi:antagonist of KipI
VDAGRPHHRRLGVPVGGAADRAALALGNSLLGNPPFTTALEFALAGPTLEATADHACVVYGAPFGVWINDRAQPLGKTFNLHSGDILTIGTSPTGLRAYLCIRGGFRAARILDSTSSLEPLQNGLELEAEPSVLRPRFFRPPEAANDTHLLRVLPGTHAELCGKDQFVAQEYTVSADSNRMGLRLSGQPLTQTGEELVSAPVCPGTVQVTHDGQTVVLGVDAQTIGGYPRMAHVVSADLDKLAQLRPQDRLRFAWVDLPTAQNLFQARQTWLREWIARLRFSLV